MLFYFNFQEENRMNIITFHLDIIIIIFLQMYLYLQAVDSDPGLTKWPG